MRQHKAERDQDDDLPGDRQKQGGACLPESDVDILQGHLHEKHNGTHQKQGAVALYDSGHRVTGGEQPGVQLRYRKRDRPDRNTEDKGDYRDVPDAFFQPIGVSFAVIVADERLHSVSQPVERQGDQLQGAEHDRQGGGIVLVTAGCTVEIDVENDLNGTFGQRHDERGKAERQDVRQSGKGKAHFSDPEAEQALSGKEKTDDADAGDEL